jgi:hypothetical protein
MIYQGLRATQIGLKKETTLTEFSIANLDQQIFFGHQVEQSVAPKQMSLILIVRNSSDQKCEISLLKSSRSQRMRSFTNVATDLHGSI